VVSFPPVSPAKPYTPPLLTHNLTLAYRTQLNFSVVKIIYDISTNTSPYIQQPYYRNVIFNEA